MIHSCFSSWPCGWKAWRITAAVPSLCPLGVLTSTEWPGRRRHRCCPGCNLTMIDYRPTHCPCAAHTARPRHEASMNTLCRLILLQISWIYCVSQLTRSSQSSVAIVFIRIMISANIACASTQRVLSNKFNHCCISRSRRHHSLISLKKHY